MKRFLSLLLVLSLLAALCACQAEKPAQTQQTEPPASDPEEQAPVFVTTFTGTVFSHDSALLVTPDAGSLELQSADLFEIALADGLVPCGADGWPIAISELLPGMRLDITYLGEIQESYPARVLAVAIRVVAANETVQDPEPEQPVLPEPEPEPFSPVEITAPLYGAQPPEPYEAQTPYGGTTSYGFPAVETLVVCEAQYDLDACGQTEDIQLLCIRDEFAQSSYVMRVVKDGIALDAGVLIDYGYGLTQTALAGDAHIVLTDLDQDGILELFFYGDFASDDDMLCGFTLGAEDLVPLSLDGLDRLDARITGFTERSIELTARLNILGSWSGRRVYHMEGGALVPSEDRWTRIFPQDMDVTPLWLTVCRDLPVTLEDGSEQTLAVGTQLLVLASDDRSFAQAELSDGTKLTIFMEQNGAQWQIAGQDDWSYFELLNYAG